jgi:polyisoprenoid-binding protein YceI
MRRIVIGLVVGLALVGGGAFAYVWFAGGSGEPTTDVTAPPLAPAPTTAPPDGSTDASAPSTSTTGATSSARAYVILEGESTARFELDEELRGSPKRVVGTTSEVAGQFRFDPDDLSGAEVSEILINARTFETDSSSRDRAIRGPVVLDSASDEFELITFTPTTLEGLPESAAVGDAIEFTVSGDLTIRGTTNPETFEVEATWTAEDRIEGTATTTVDRTDYGIGIPNVPFVANVSEEVLLALDFVAQSS